MIEHLQFFLFHVLCLYLCLCPAHFDLYFFPCFDLVLVMMVMVKVRLHAMVLEETVIASEIVMVNVSVRENKMASVTENVRENVIVTENVTVSMRLMVPVMEKGCHVWNSLLLHHRNQCH